VIGSRLAAPRSGLADPIPGRRVVPTAPRRTRRREVLLPDAGLPSEGQSGHGTWDRGTLLPIPVVRDWAGRLTAISGRRREAIGRDFTAYKE